MCARWRSTDLGREVFRLNSLANIVKHKMTLDDLEHKVDEVVAFGNCEKEIGVLCGTSSKNNA